MEWPSLGFKKNPLNTDPIKQETLPLYVGHEEQLAICKNVLKESNINLVVEGARGVGTTSFANYLRFLSQKSEDYFTPRNEIKVEKGRALETILAVVIANVVREIELFQPETIIQDKRFQDAKALSARIAEAYRAFGINAFGFGVSYGKNAGISSQPIIVPSAVLGHHLEDLAALIKKIGYKYGILVQFNNLDIGTIHDEEHMKYLFNAIRDYLQIDGISWIFVGDIGLRRFIAQEVDRLDDIISYEIELPPLQESEYELLVEKRLLFYGLNPKVEIPIDKDVFSYLYKITKGRLRYIFGLLTRLVNSLSLGDLTDRITLNIAKPMIIRLAKERVQRNDLAPSEENVLKNLVNMNNPNVADLAKRINKSAPYISKILSRLVTCKLVSAKRHGKNKYYTPVLDANIAYADIGD